MNSVAGALLDGLFPQFFCKGLSAPIDAVLLITAAVAMSTGIRG